MNDAWLPRDWRVERWTDTSGKEHVIVFRPDSSSGMTMDEAIVLRDLLTTSSRAHLRRAIRVA